MEIQRVSEGVGTKRHENLKPEEVKRGKWDNLRNRQRETKRRKERGNTDQSVWPVLAPQKQMTSGWLPISWCDSERLSEFTPALFSCSWHFPVTFIKRRQTGNCNHTAHYCKLNSANSVLITEFLKICLLIESNCFITIKTHSLFILCAKI